MTFEEFVLRANVRAARSRFERRGQAYFNVLHDERPDIAQELVGGPLDPFYDDSKLDAFLAAVAERW